MAPDDAPAPSPPEPATGASPEAGPSVPSDVEGAPPPAPPTDAPATQDAPPALPSQTPPSDAPASLPAGTPPSTGAPLLLEPAPTPPALPEVGTGTAAEAAPPAAPSPPRPRSPLATGLEFAWRARRALLVVTLAQLLFGLTIALPLRARVAPYLDAHPHATALANEPDAFDRASGWVGGLDWSLMQDVRRREAPFFDGVALALVWVGLAAWVFGQAVAGGFLAIANDDEALAELRSQAVFGDRPLARLVLEQPSGPGGTWDAVSLPARVSASRFLEAAGRWFFPMLRTSVVFLVLMEGFVRRVVFETWGGIASVAQGKAATDTVPWWGAREREIVYLVLFLFFRAAADLGRAHLVAKGRRSAALAFARGIGTLVRHPLRAGGLAILVAIPEMLLLAACAWLLALFPGGNALHLIGAFLALQLAVYVRWSARAALLAGDVALVRRTTTGNKKDAKPEAREAGTTAGK